MSNVLFLSTIQSFLQFQMTNHRQLHAFNPTRNFMENKDWLWRLDKSCQLISTQAGFLFYLRGLVNIILTIKIPNPLDLIAVVFGLGHPSFVYFSCNCSWVRGCRTGLVFSSVSFTLFVMPASAWAWLSAVLIKMLGYFSGDINHQGSFTLAYLSQILEDKSKVVLTCLLEHLYNTLNIIFCTVGAAQTNLQAVTTFTLLRL